MDSRQFQALQAQVQRLLVQLTGKQVDELREGWRHALDAGRVPTPQQLLRAALFLIVF